MISSRSFATHWTAPDLEGRYLEVELTESVVMSDPEESIAILEKLSAMGVLVSVDDFGTGYSSMSYLRRLPSTRSRSTGDSSEKSCRGRTMPPSCARSSRSPTT